MNRVAEVLGAAVIVTMTLAAITAVVYALGAVIGAW